MRKSPRLWAFPIFAEETEILGEFRYVEEETEILGEFRYVEEETEILGEFRYVEIFDHATFRVSFIRKL